MKTQGDRKGTQLLSGSVALITLLFLACGTAAPETPRATTSTPSPIGTMPRPTSTPSPTETPGATVAPPATGDASAGQTLFTSKFICYQCHTIQGLSTGQVGPELTHIATVAASRKPPLSAEAYIKESIENPEAYIVEGFPPAMPGLRAGMTDAEFGNLIAFLLAQK